MPSFIFYDLTFLVIFTAIVVFLFHKYRANWKRQGWIFLYHSKFGLKFIDWTARTFKGVLKPLQYVVITSGYILMAGIIWIMSFSAWRYITAPIPQQLQNVPPIAPLIPYFPRLFGLDSFFPPLFFTYFLVALAVVAVSHEFSHGIFARLNKIKVKTTGLAFFGPFFGAFVEPDEKQMNKSKKFPQLAILAAGTFANVVMTVLFLLILWIFFTASFVPAGINFNAYPNAVVNLADITSIEGNFIDSIEDIPEFIEDELNEITISNGETFLASGEGLERAVSTQAEQIIVFEDAPAVRARFTGPILEIDGEKITSQVGLSEKLSNYEVGEEIEITTIGEDENKEKIRIKLGDREGRAYLGVGFINNDQKSYIARLITLTQEIRDPLIYYEPTWDGEFVQFIYDLLWWIVVINILVALFNMLPVSILDGGRFFYLTIWGLMGSEKIGRKTYSFATWFILALLAVMMIRWVLGLL